MLLVEFIVLQIKKKSHMTEVWELHKICHFIYWLIAFTLKNIATAKAYTVFFLSHSFWISLHEWILGKFKIFVALKCSNKHNMDSKAYQILHRKQILCVICTFLFLINEP